MTTPQDWKPVDKSAGRFVKGFDPRRQPGGVDAKTRKLRKALAKLDTKALALLARFMDSDEPSYQLEALKLWAKYRLPVPTEKTPGVELPGESQGPTLSPELRARLARLT